MNPQPDDRTTIEAFLATPPAGTPPAVLALLRSAIEGEAGLPMRLYFEAVEQAPLPISITDHHANILYANEAFARVTGYSRGEVLGHNESVLSDKSTPPIVYQTLWGRLTQRRSWTGMLVNRRKNGERYVAEVAIAPVLDPAGNTTNYLGMHRDMTDSVRLEQEIQNQQALIQSVVDTAPELLLVLDGDGQVALRNRACWRLSGELFEGDPIELLVAGLGEAYQRCRDEGIPFTGYELRLPLANGQGRWFVCAGIRFEVKEVEADNYFEPRQTEFTLITAQEITSLKRQQEEARMNALRALLAEQELGVAMRETLVASSHQLQLPLNLLNAAIGMLERRLRREGIEEDAALRVLMQVREEGLAAIDRLERSLPEQPPEPFTTININELIHQVLMLATERLLRLGITIDWRPAARLPGVPGAEGALRGMLKQLIDNAVEAIDGTRASRRDISIRAAAAQGWLTLTIEDSGPGVPQELRHKIFEPFFSTKGNRGSRAGMGLALVQEVVNRHAGTVEIDPDFQAGCRVRVRLPLSGPHQGSD